VPVPAITPPCRGCGRGINPDGGGAEWKHAECATATETSGGTSDECFEAFYAELPYPEHVTQEDGESSQAFISRLTREWLRLVYVAGWDKRGEQ